MLEDDGDDAVAPVVLVAPLDLEDLLPDLRAITSPQRVKLILR